MKLRTVLCTAVFAAAAAGSAVFAGPPGDECASPVALSGTASFFYDSNLYTTSTPGVFAPQCFPAPASVPFVKDAWICWTASCTGLVTVDMCAPAGVPDGTRAAMWPGCGCPGDAEPLCCSDTSCGKDARFTCEVVCGQQYMIRIGCDPGMQGVTREVHISCDGKPCGGAAPCADCCARPPRVTNFTAPVTVGTSWEDQPGEKVVHVFDVSQYATQLPGPWAAPVYEHADWTMAKLGSVFGVTMDGAGNIYVAHSSVYGSDSLGSLGGGAGAIYKLDSASGAPSLFCTLPNTDTCAPAATCAPGLGNLTYSCAHDCIYCSNMEDGRIYRISMTGAKLEAYDFGDQAIESAAADTTDPVGPAALGRRTFAVGVAGDRLYFSVWREDQSAPSATASNEIWSIPLTAGTGAFAGATPTLEITVPPYLGTDYSGPVLDLAFDNNCCMYLAERTMYGPTQSSAHQSRLLKFCGDAAGGTGWTASADTFESGCCFIPDSNAGGVGIDLGAGGLVWTTSDAMAFGPTYYGMIGLPTTGGTNAQGLLIDMNGDTVNVDKTYVGSVEVACKVADVCAATVEATCHLGADGLPDGQYNLSITVHNGLDGAVANLLLLPDLGTFVHLIPGMQPGEDRKINILTSLLAPGTTTMDIGLYTNMCPNCQCCGVLGVEFEVPDCECMILEGLHVTCHPDRDPTTYWYDVTYLMHNVSPFIVRHLFIVPVDLAVTTTPEYVQLPFLLPGQTFPIAFTLKFPGAPPVGTDGEWHTQVSLSLFAQSLSFCCKRMVDLHGPLVCASNIMGDLNNDGVVDGADLGIMLSDWGQVPFGGCTSDLNNDGVVDGGDLGVMLGGWGG